MRWLRNIMYLLTRPHTSQALLHPQPLPFESSLARGISWFIVIQTAVSRPNAPVGVYQSVFPDAQDMAQSKLSGDSRC
jgi:hypothetical protein